jgi:hypothetical protein
MIRTSGKRAGGGDGAAGDEVGAQLGGLALDGAFRKSLSEE